MSAKIHHSALFLSALISLIYAVCWVPFSFFFDKIILFSINHQVPPTKLHFLIGSLYLSITTFLVFILMKKQIRQTALLRSKLTIADEILENRVKQRIAEIEKSFGDIKKINGNYSNLRQLQKHPERVRTMGKNRDLYLQTL